MSNPTEFRLRRERAKESLADRGASALLVTPGSNLAYLTGYRAPDTERLTCFAVSHEGPAVMLVPELELALARAAVGDPVDLEIRPWPEPSDPIRLMAGWLEHVADRGERVLVDDQLWAVRLLALVDRLPDRRWEPAASALTELRIRKSPIEVEALIDAGAAVDAVHELTPELLRPGRSERDVAADLHGAMLAAGHAAVDFVIVAAGPNSASPHHEPDLRPLAFGDAVVVDIGGRLPSGYCSDSTRTYHLGPPTEEFTVAYESLRQAQVAGVEAARAGNTCAAVDAACRDRLTEAGLGRWFVHRTGHGIGLDTHEEPYIIDGNQRELEPGYAFSVEPGFYLPGRYGARIEDIVICTDSGPIVCNHRPRDLFVIDP